MPAPARLVCAALLAAALPAAGDDSKSSLEDLSPVGKPAGYHAGASTRYAVWYEGGTWHLRTTTGTKGTHAFEGKVEIVGGKMVSLKPVAVEAKGKQPDVGVWNPEHTVFTFDLRTSKGHTDGFDLKVSDGTTALKFTLLVAGEPAPGRVFVGAKGAHPKAAAFSLPARPEK
jgi:hypothetical protein